MGSFVNPGNRGFQKIRNGTYVDKSELISVINRLIDTPDSMVCFSRPRRFGKSFAAKMLCAYYDRSCDSRSLFADLSISQDPSFSRYLNQFNVLYLDISWFISFSQDIHNIVAEMQKKIIADLRSTFTDCVFPEHAGLGEALFVVADNTGIPFFVIIDEWDALFRETKNQTAIQHQYVQLLRGLFKGGMVTDQTIAGAYMTGILPIKKYGTESALTDFQEFTMVDPGDMAAFVGFTQGDVQALCDQYDMDMRGMEQWYNGYCLEGVGRVYSPNSVMNALRKRRYANYWTKTETYESLKTYITLNLDGLRDDIISMLGGRRIKVDTLQFQNDVISFRSKYDVMTLLIHLGYLAYDQNTQQAYIPNLEVSDSFRLAVQHTGWEDIARALTESDELLDATIAGHADVVASALNHVHESSSSVLQYNNENSLACALTIAYYTARRDYQIIRELPAGKGFADLAFIPRPVSEKPAMLLELKYNQDAETAIRQIKEKRYDGALKDFRGRLLLVGVSYDKTSKTHSCIIEKV